MSAIPEVTSRPVKPWNWLRGLPARMKAVVEAIHRNGKWLAMSLFVGSWSALWAHGLRILDGVPYWLAVAGLLTGLALIPCSIDRGK